LDRELRKAEMSIKSMKEHVTRTACKRKSTKILAIRLMVSTFEKSPTHNISDKCIRYGELVMFAVRKNKTFRCYFVFLSRDITGTMYIYK
jgi:hypothetical protein